MKFGNLPTKKTVRNQKHTGGGFKWLHMMAIKNVKSTPYLVNQLKLFQSIL